MMRLLISGFFLLLARRTLHHDRVLGWVWVLRAQRMVPTLCVSEYLHNRLDRERICRWWNSNRKTALDIISRINSVRQQSNAIYPDSPSIRDLEERDFNPNLWGLQ